MRPVSRTLESIPPRTVCLFPPPLPVTFFFFFFFFPFSRAAFSLQTPPARPRCPPLQTLMFPFFLFPIFLPTLRFPFDVFFPFSVCTSRRRPWSGRPFDRRDSVFISQFQHFFFSPFPVYGSPWGLVYGSPHFRPRRIVDAVPLAWTRLIPHLPFVAGLFSRALRALLLRSVRPVIPVDFGPPPDVLFDFPTSFYPVRPVTLAVVIFGFPSPTPFLLL